MRVVVAGGSGFLGRHLCTALEAGGHEVTRLVRRRPGNADKNDAEAHWDPTRADGLGPGALAGADAVVNLAGANVGATRWTDSYQRTLVNSRVDTTTTLARTMAGLPAGDRPRVFLAGSAVGFYGDTGATAVTERDPHGEGFLADLCQVWEAASRPAEDAGVRVAHLRTGFPLAGDGGLLAPMLVQFRLFAGGRMGSGRQYLPWISMADWIGAARFVLDRDDIAGPVNLVGPAPATNAEFARTLGRVLGRPSFWVIPGPVLRLALGGFGGEALASQRVLPEVLSSAGFAFRHPDLESALRAAVR